MRHTSAAARSGFNALALNEEDQFIEDLRGMVWSGSVTGKRSWKDIAEESGLNVATVSKFASGDTKRPHLLTIRRIVRACGYRMAFVPTGVSTVAEVDLSSFRNVKRR